MFNQDFARIRYNMFSDRNAKSASRYASYVSHVGFSMDVQGQPCHHRPWYHGDTVDFSTSRALVISLYADIFFVIVFFSCCIVDYFLITAERIVFVALLVMDTTFITSYYFFIKKRCDEIRTCTGLQRSLCLEWLVLEMLPPLNERQWQLSAGDGF